MRHMTDKNLYQNNPSSGSTGFQLLAIKDQHWFAEMASGIT